MWARIVEACLGCWLIISPFIFSETTEGTLIWASDLAGGAVVLTIALASCWKPLEKAHLLQLAAAAYLIGLGFLAAPPPPPPPFQNFIVIGLLLLVLGIIPGRASLPPRGWQAYYAGRRETR